MVFVLFAFSLCLHKKKRKKKVNLFMTILPALFSLPNQRIQVLRLLNTILLNSKFGRLIKIENNFYALIT